MSNDLRGNDPRRSGHSLANLIEVLSALLNATGAKSVIEVGAFAGDLTTYLLDWADGAGARVIAVDPEPQPELAELAGTAHLELIREPSVEALAHLPRTDAVIIDGDHNYYTVSEELRLTADRFPGPRMPLLLLHDVCWPHARRDAYYVPERIPDEYRQPLAEGGGVIPDEPGIVPGGLPFKWVAEREGGARNGVLTAFEDFLGERPELRSAIVPAFFGLGAVWAGDAPWAGEVEAILAPLDRNPVLARMEANRAHHLAQAELKNPEAERLRELNEEKSNLLRGMLESRALALGERLAKLRNPGHGRSWREQAKRLIDRDAELR